jgi:oligoribonuclease (3'-5' exoribonuclease)
VNGFVVKMHQKSGLLDDLAATGEVRVLDVIGSLTSFLNEMVVAGARIGRGFDPSVDRPFHPAGFSVHTDINHLKRWGCRSVLQMLHHRHADVSALKLFYRAWVGEVPERREEPEHRAMPDVEESIEMAKWFRDVFQRGAPRPNPKNIEDIRFPAVLFRALKEFDEKENSQDLKNLSTPSTL